MTRFLISWPQPTDVEAFEKHYLATHVPLSKSMPHLRSYKIARNPRPIRGDEQPYIIAELEWDSMDDLRADMGSPIGAELTKDVDELSKLAPGVRSWVYDLEQL